MQYNGSSGTFLHFARRDDKLIVRNESILGMRLKFSDVSCWRGSNSIELILEGLPDPIMSWQKLEIEENLGVAACSLCRWYRNKTLAGRHKLTRRKRHRDRHHPLVVLREVNSPDFLECGVEHIRIYVPSLVDLAPKILPFHLYQSPASS